jgi:hypothetical protein
LSRGPSARPGEGVRARDANLGKVGRVVPNEGGYNKYTQIHLSHTFVDSRPPTYVFENPQSIRQSLDIASTFKSHTVALKVAAAKNASYSSEELGSARVSPGLTIGSDCPLGTHIPTISLRPTLPRCGTCRHANLHVRVQTPFSRARLSSKSSLIPRYAFSSLAPVLPCLISTASNGSRGSRVRSRD